MVRVQLAFVPPGGGETDYSLDAELPGVPQPRDYIAIQAKGETGLSNFIVRRVWWWLEFEKGEAAEPATVRKLMVECEFARGPFTSDEHESSCKMYEARGKKVPGMDESMY